MCFKLKDWGGVGGEKRCVRVRGESRAISRIAWTSGELSFTSSRIYLEESDR